MIGEDRGKPLWTKKEAINIRGKHRVYLDSGIKT
jgi:hypothetical protein